MIFELTLKVSGSIEKIVTHAITMHKNSQNAYDIYNS